MNFTPQDKGRAECEAEAQQELQRYCDEHPRSPTAIRRPKVLLRGRSWIALLGYTLEDGVAGIGSTVRDALRSFDVQYQASTKPARG